MYVIRELFSAYINSIDLSRLSLQVLFNLHDYQGVYKLLYPDLYSSTSTYLHDLWLSFPGFSVDDDELSVLDRKFGSRLVPGCVVPVSCLDHFVSRAADMQYVSVTQDQFHFDTVFPNVIYENKEKLHFVRVLNSVINCYIYSTNNNFCTVDPSASRYAAAA